MEDDERRGQLHADLRPRRQPVDRPLAFDPRNSDVLYVGTGEASPGSGSVTCPGDGVWKTTNGGATWQQTGLEDTVAIGRIAIHPASPDTVFVAAMGNVYSRNTERGVAERVYLADPAGGSGGHSTMTSNANSARSNRSSKTRSLTAYWPASA
jgi:hypothetical protein